MSAVLWAIGVLFLAILASRLLLVVRGGPRPASGAVFRADDRVLFITAHPDDECMFFSPSIKAAVRDAGKQNVHVLCLSTGNFYGQGRVRSKELVASCRQLGLDTAHVSLVDHSDLQDGAQWSGDVVAEHIADHLQANQSLDLTKVVSFDAHGVSSHPNHLSVFHGLRQLQLTGTLPAGLQVLTLDSVGLLSKYISVMPVLWTRPDNSLTVVSDTTDWWSGVLAMLEHRSQLLWFRYLYVLLSRYMWINNFTILQPG